MGEKKGKGRVLRLALAQINSTVGDLEGNAVRILEYVGRARKLNADLVVFPELALTGYPPEDLLLKPRFVRENLRVLRELAGKVKGISACVGFVDRKVDIYNACALISEGNIVDIYSKCHLPNYGVFDEKRYFQSGGAPAVYEVGGVRVGINICEDIWYPDGPARTQSIGGGAEVIVNLNASPYDVEKPEFRRKMLANRAADNAVFVAACNLVGGQDELVFDGRGMVFDPEGVLLVEGEPFVEELLAVDLDMELVFHRRLHDPRRRELERSYQDRMGEVRKVTVAGAGIGKARAPLPPAEKTSFPIEEEVFRALCLGTRDYVRKSGFKRVLVGLSGGIDSSLVAVIAVHALGKEQVTGVFMPSPYTSRESIEDASALAESLGIETLTIPISDIFQDYLKSLEPVFAGRSPDLAEENIQARIRGNLLMALSNKFGWIVLTTGNKSEMGVGYATLYGDMAGGFAVIKDISKTFVWELSEYINRREGREVIPERVIQKPPSAELRPDQKDEDSIPPYRDLDPILKAYIEEDQDLEEIVKLGFPEETVRRTMELVDRSEYKRRQAPPGVKITPRALGKDRRMPIINKFT